MSLTTEPQTTTDRVATVPCSLATREAEEDPAGTAAEVRTWVVVFRAGPWGVPALDDAPELAAVAKGMPGVKVVLAEPLVPGGPSGRARPARRPGSRPRRQRETAAVLVGTLPRQTWRADVPGTMFDVVRTLHDPAVRQALSEGRDPEVGVASDRPAVLVCTHAAKDSCCGRTGPAAAETVAASLPRQRRAWGRARPVVDVYRTSHLGGHRFAPTAVVLPWGLMLGGLGPSPDDLAVVVAGALQGRPLVEGYRGRSAYRPTAQAAEIAVRRLLATRGVEAGPDDVVADPPVPVPRTAAGDGGPTPEAPPPDTPAGPGPRAVVVDVRHANGSRFRVTVDRAASGRRRPVSCGAPAKPFDAWVTEVAAV